MNEAEWLACADSEEMLLFLPDTVNHRKRRLLGCACVRRVWHSLPDDCLRQGVEVCERFADGLASEGELRAARDSAQGTYEGIGDIIADHGSLAVTELCEGKVSLSLSIADRISAVAAEEKFDQETPWHVARAREQLAQCELIRDIVGNPFRPAILSPSVRTPEVVNLAQATYEERLLPSGQLHPDRLAVLADALDDAGADAELVKHLRTPGAHVRGCFVLDLLLGKE
jgi:hypothetical protein